MDGLDGTRASATGGRRRRRRRSRRCGRRAPAPTFASGARRSAPSRRSSELLDAGVLGPAPEQVRHYASDRWLGEHLVAEGVERADEECARSALGVRLGMMQAPSPTSLVASMTTLPSSAALCVASSSGTAAPGVASRTTSGSQAPRDRDPPRDRPGGSDDREAYVTSWPTRRHALSDRGADIAGADDRDLRHGRSWVGNGFGPDSLSVRPDPLLWCTRTAHLRSCTRSVAGMFARLSGGTTSVDASRSVAAQSPPRGRPAVRGRSTDRRAGNLRVAW